MPYTAKASGGYQGPPIPDDLYVLEVKGVTLLPANGVPDNFGNIKDKLRIKFQLVDLEDEDGEPVFVDPMVTNSLSDGAGGRFPASNYWKICIALGAEPENGIDSDNLIGLRCKGMVTTDPEEGSWPRITQYARIAKGAGTQAPARGNGGSRPSQRTTEPVLGEESPFPGLKVSQTADPAERISKWWAKTRAAGLDRKEVIDQSKFAYDGREPAELTGEELDSLYQMVAGV